jgi:hypothetical protein
MKEAFANLQMAKSSKIIKVAGLSLVGFCAVSLAADKVALSAGASQLAGYCGAFLGALVARGRSGKPKQVTDTAKEPEIKGG